MRNMLKLFGLSMGVGALVIGGADAVDNSRAGYNISRLNRAGGATSRMVTMPVIGKPTLGNTVVDTSHGGISGTTVEPGSTGSVETPEEVEYKVDDCMDDILRCVNGGALPGGLNDLFDADARNMIFSAGGICVTQVENCIEQLGDRYKSPSDVWYEFNQRKIQPEYYNFVLRQTGLTPFQAQETCKRLDNEMYGTSFTAQHTADNTTTITNEYNKAVGTYNNQTTDAKKSVVDNVRGYYARWDATQGQCLVRVAAYNNDKLVTNSWLWGAIGDETPAEVWKKTGDSFKCNKDLFGFALLNNTKTVALVGVGGGTLLGAGIGAATGKKKHAFDCSDKNSLKQLSSSITESDKALLSEYDIEIGNELTTDNCKALVELKAKYDGIKKALKECDDNAGKDFVKVVAAVTADYYDDEEKEWFVENLPICIDDKGNVKDDEDCMDAVSGLCKGVATAEQCEEKLAPYADVLTYNIIEMRGDEACKFKSIKKVSEIGKYNCNPDAVADGADCWTADGIRKQLSEVSGVIGHLKLTGQEKSTIGRNAGIGAAAGAAAGGVATAITAFVERSNISCHVGDNLAKVSMGKSYNIETLRDFYVKWGMNLSDLQPTETNAVTSKAEWSSACSKYNNDLDTCLMLKVKVNDTTVSSACRVQSGRCVANDLVMAGSGLN